MGDDHFSWLDYSVFGVMLLSSALIGVYFAFFAKQKQNTIVEYLMGGKTMGIFPISMSNIATYISGIVLLGIPAEIYLYGTQYWLSVFAQIFVGFTTYLIFLPVFYKLQITSSYEYLNLRFGPAVRLIGSILFIVKMLFLIPIIVYFPALAFNQVTGINVHLITPVVCVVCIFYTTLGGLKAVVWTDTLQTVIMFGGVIVVMVLGTIKVGGVSEVFVRSRESERLEIFNMDPDPTVRHTFWTVLLGSYVSRLAAVTVNQAGVQRYLSLPTIKKANYTIVVSAVGLFCIDTMCCFTGLIVYAYFYDCDPVTTKIIRKPDQVLPYFVMLMSETVPGLPGLFMAGVFSAALSSMSTGLNSMAGVIFEDMIRPMVRTPISEPRASSIMKVMAALLGFVCVAMVFVVENLGSLIQVVQSLMSVVSGPLLGMFTLGMCFPWANDKGAMAGGLSGFVVTAWISFTAQSHARQGLITYQKKELNIDGCAAVILNSTVITPFLPTSDDVFWLYRLSYMYYALVGLLVTLVVGLLVSFITGARDAREIPRDLLAPVIHRFLPKYEPDLPLEEQTACMERL